MAGSNTAEKKKPQSADIVDISGDKVKYDSVKKPTVKKKKGSGVKLVILFLVFFLMLASAAVVIYSNDFFGVRTTVYELAHSIDPAYRGITEREAELNARDEKQTELQSKLESEQERLAAFEQQLSAKEQNIMILERSNTPVYRQPINEDDIVYMKNIGKIYAAMEPASAADIMVRLYSVEDMAAIIYYMSQDSAASVLALIDHQVAAQITDQLLHN